MSEPRRWLSERGSSLEAALLRAAQTDAPPAGAKQRALAALGLADASPRIQAKNASVVRMQPPARREMPSGIRRRLPVEQQIRSAPAASVALFESVLRPRGQGEGLFGFGGTAMALGAAAACLAVLFARPPRIHPSGPSGVEVSLSELPAPKTQAPAAPVAPEQRPTAATVAAPHSARAAQRTGIAGAGEPSSSASDADPQPPASDVDPSADAPAATDAIALADPQQNPTPALPAEAVPAVSDAASTMASPRPSEIIRPVLISGRNPVYTREALAARVEGTVVVKCTITTAGTLVDCRVLQSVPHMDQAVLDAMATRRYSPATYRGRPVATDHVFNFRFVLPK